MGNRLGGKKTAKVMKINGETFKLKTPVKAGEVVKDYPGHVLLESEAVKYYGVRAKPLEPHQNLVPKRLYFLVELPKAEAEKEVARRARSGIVISAKDRLDRLMLARRSTLDFSILNSWSNVSAENTGSSSSGSGGMRVKMRLPKAEVMKLMRESRDQAEAAAKIVDLCAANGGRESHEVVQNRGESVELGRQKHWRDGHGRVSEGLKTREKEVRFL